MIHSNLKNARITDATKSSGHKYWIEHPQNDAILASADTMEEAEEFVAALEEINLTKIEIDFLSERDLPAIGKIVEKNGQKWRIVDNAVRNIATAELVK